MNIEIASGAQRAGGRRSAVPYIARGLAALAAAGFMAGAAAAQAPELIAAAQAEGEVIFYTSTTENIGRDLGAAFTKKYGIPAKFIRAAGANLTGRYASEAQAGAIAADVLIYVDSQGAFATDGLANGWFEDIWKTDLPVVAENSFPERFRVGPSAIVSIQPWFMFYNTDLVAEADVPKDWPDILDPKWKGRILIPDPKASPAYMEFWNALEQKYGEEFFDRLRAQDIRFGGGGGPVTIQSLAAGEAALGLPTTPSSVLDTKSKGGPVDVAPVAFTTGVEMQLLLSKRERSPNPNAGALFANFVLSEEGAAIMAMAPGNVSPYDAVGLPAEYAEPDKSAPGRSEEIYRKLGL